jgi:hypothetical protein
LLSGYFFDQENKEDWKMAGRPKDCDSYNRDRFAWGKVKRQDMQGFARSIVKIPEVEILNYNWIVRLMDESEKTNIKLSFPPFCS